MRNQLERGTEVGHAAGHRPQDEPGADAGQVEDGLVLQAERVGELHDGVCAHDHAQVPPGQQQGQPDRQPASRTSPTATASGAGTTPAATGRRRLVGCCRSARRRSRRSGSRCPRRRRQKMPKAAGRVPQDAGVEEDAGRGGGHEDQEVLDPLPGPGEADEAVRQRPGPALCCGGVVVGSVHSLGRCGHWVLVDGRGRWCGTVVGAPPRASRQGLPGGRRGTNRVGPGRAPGGRPGSGRMSGDPGWASHAPSV